MTTSDKPRTYDEIFALGRAEGIREAVRAVEGRALQAARDCRDWRLSDLGRNEAARLQNHLQVANVLLRTLIPASSEPPATTVYAESNIDEQQRGVDRAMTPHRAKPTKADQVGADDKWEVGQVRLVRKPGDSFFSAPMVLVERHYQPSREWTLVDGVKARFMAHESWESRLLETPKPSEAPVCKAGCGTKDGCRGVRWECHGGNRADGLRQCFCSDACLALGRPVNSGSRSGDTT